jgi:hypothetical protein
MIVVIEPWADRQKKFGQTGTSKLQQYYASFLIGVRGDFIVAMDLRTKFHKLRGLDLEGYATGIFVISQSPVHSNRHLASSHIVAKDVQSLNANCSVAIVQPN